MLTKVFAGGLAGNFFDQESDEIEIEFIGVESGAGFEQKWRMGEGRHDRRRVGCGSMLGEAGREIGKFRESRRVTQELKNADITPFTRTIRKVRTNGIVEVDLAGRFQLQDSGRQELFRNRFRWEVSVALTFVISVVGRIREALFQKIVITRGNKNLTAKTLFARLGV